MERQEEIRERENSQNPTTTVLEIRALATEHNLMGSLNYWWYMQDGLDDCVTSATSSISHLMGQLCMYHEWFMLVEMCQS